MYNQCKSSIREVTLLTLHKHTSRTHFSISQVGTQPLYLNHLGRPLKTTVVGRPPKSRVVVIPITAHAEAYLAHNIFIFLSFETIFFFLLCHFPTGNCRYWKSPVPTRYLIQPPVRSGKYTSFRRSKLT